LNKARQRKLEARRRRLAALHSVPSEKDSVVENTNKDLVTVPVVIQNESNTSKTRKSRGRPMKKRLPKSE
jgi:hypothetical protein